jgi:FKBP-type peptidyl-prolyl cis-trans isomerase
MLSGALSLSAFAQKPEKAAKGKPEKAQQKPAKDKPANPKSEAKGDNRADVAKERSNASNASSKSLPEVNTPPWPVDSSQIKTTASGLRYFIYKQGEGRIPQAGEKVVAHYHGLLTNGQKFDSSFDRGKPFSFSVGQGQVIKGWDEGFALLPVGTRAVLFIPPTLGYGSRDMGVIPPNSDLVFHVELLEIQEAFKPYKLEEGKLQTTASGLQYQIVKEGTGAQATAGKTVSVHYHGTLMDGKVFDSSFSRGEPIAFPLGQGMVIPGWEEGIALLKEGSRAILIIPPGLAYGANGAPPVIPGNATLRFDVELVKVQ